MIFDYVSRKIEFSHRSRDLPSSGKDNWPRLVVGHLQCEQPFHKCLLLALWALDGSVVGFPLQGSDVKHRLSYRGAGSVCFFFPVTGGTVSLLQLPLLFCYYCLFCFGEVEEESRLYSQLFGSLDFAKLLCLEDAGLVQT